MDQTQNHRRLWPRFSLLMAFLLTTLVAMGVVIALLWREVGPLRATVRRMRIDLGQLTIDDPTRAYGIQVRQYDKDLWRWQIYLPPGRQYSLHCLEGILPVRDQKPLRLWLDSMPQLDNVAMISGSGLDGERTWEASIKERNGLWTVQTTPGRISTDIKFKDDWFAGTRLVGGDLQVDSQATFAPDQPILLLYIPKPNVTPGSGGGTNYDWPTGAAEGIVMWIEQHPSVPGASTPATTVPPEQ
ncbi:MAG TPA: hypothetical protein VGM76_17525 [Lacipirellulaceae bacterium]